MEICGHQVGSWHSHPGCGSKFHFHGSPRSFRGVPAMPSFQRSGTASRSSFGPTCCYARVKRRFFLTKLQELSLDMWRCSINTVCFDQPPCFFESMWNWCLNMMVYYPTSERGLLLWFLVVCFFQHVEAASQYLQNTGCDPGYIGQWYPAHLWDLWCFRVGGRAVLWSIEMLFSCTCTLLMQRCYSSSYPIF